MHYLIDIIFLKVEDKWKKCIYMYEIAKTPQIRSKALCIAEGDGVYFPQFEKKIKLIQKMMNLIFLYENMHDVWVF